MGVNCLLVGATTLVVAFLLSCGDGSGKAPPPTQSDTVEVPFQITTVYALEQSGDSDFTARARYYDALQTIDVFGNAGTIALSPGDATFADGTRLDIETRTETLGTLRVDYSQTVAKGKARYDFELRRPNDESITASIRPPEPFTMEAIESGAGLVTITWGPVLKDTNAAVYLTAKNGCALFDEGFLLRPAPDTGRHQWAADSFRSSVQDCHFTITVERRTRTTEPATWRKGNRSLPTNGVHAEALRTESVDITLAKRSQ